MYKQSTRGSCLPAAYFLVGEKKNVNTIISESYKRNKGNKLSSVIECDWRQERGNCVREAGRRRPEGWRLRRSQPDEELGQDAASRGRSECQSIPGELKKLGCAKKGSTGGCSVAKANLEFEVQWEAPAGF